MVCKNLGKVYACCVQKSRKGELFRNECQMGYSLYPYCNGYIGQALFSSLKLRSEGLAAATLARCANVTSALMPTAPARLHASLQGLHCCACSPSAAAARRLARVQRTIGSRTSTLLPNGAFFLPTYALTSRAFKDKAVKPSSLRAAAFRRLAFY